MSKRKSNVGISERTETGKAQQHMDELFRALIENSSDIIVLLDAEGIIRYETPAVERLLGYTPAELIGTNIVERLHPDDVSKVIEAYGAINAGRTPGGTSWNGHFIEARFCHKDGLWRTMQCIFNALPSDLPVVGIVINLHDITERKRSDKALRESNDYLNKLVNYANAPIIVWDPKFRITRFNHAFERLTGYGAREVIDKDLSMLFPQVSKEESISNILDTLKGKHWVSLEVPILCKNGNIRIVLWSSANMYSEDSTSLIATIAQGHDITERKHLQKQLVQAQKMEAIGTLAGGIAHDFNNILSAIIGFTELAQMKLESDSEIKDDLKEVLTAGSRAKDLIKQILAFSCQTKEERMPVQMELIVKEALKLLRSTLPTTIDMRENIWSKSVILSDPTQLHQIVMNLCTNAAHAMREKGGILETTLTDVMLDSDFVSTHPDIHPGAYQKLTVSDTGHGIKLEVMNQIFDPFFTTKGVDEGTGLGLSVVYGIVKDCGGTITVYSEPDKGTTFNLYFPILKGTAEEKTSEYTISPTGTERILLVDDEKPIVNIITKILSSLGYDVQSRTSSIEALELFKAMPKKFDLVITDMTLPQMSGDALAQELMKIRPDLPVILCTGFSENITKEKAETMGIKVFLMKPLLKEEMAHAIRRVLDEAKGSAY
jgi:two-component system cell cycle sensor histidine kinase/response regulator CckA